jgi:2-oxoglutarate ferredoxin oxidoreductase subunit alpha
VVNVQRGGPSTGLLTKTEQSDLGQALYGRNGDSPAIVIAACTPANCFHWAFEASRLAVEHMTPVILLSENYIANGAEPWKVKTLDELDEIVPNTVADPADWMPYKRDAETLARKWVTPGTRGLEHRIGGLEKEDGTGNVSYTPENHEKMTKLRAEKVQRVADDIPLQKLKGNEAKKLLVVGWGGQFGALYGAVSDLQSEGKDIGFTHFNYINPLPKNCEEIFTQFDRILVCELNNGQFAHYLQAQFPMFRFERFNKTQGLPFKIKELKEKFNEILEE